MGKRGVHFRVLGDNGQFTGAADAPKTSQSLLSRFDTIGAFGHLQNIEEGNAVINSPKLARDRRDRSIRQCEFGCRSTHDLVVVM